MSYGYWSDSNIPADWTPDPEALAKIRANLEAIRKDFTERYGLLPTHIGVDGIVHGPKPQDATEIREEVEAAAPRQ